nr:MAG TPA: hypothetical protein [Caudoviricetes sp.]
MEIELFYTYIFPPFVYSFIISLKLENVNMQITFF